MRGFADLAYMLAVMGLPGTAFCVTFWWVCEHRFACLWQWRERAGVTLGVFAGFGGLVLWVVQAHASLLVNVLAGLALVLLVVRFPRRQRCHNMTPAPTRMLCEVTPLYQPMEMPASEAPAVIHQPPPMAPERRSADGLDRMP